MSDEGDSGRLGRLHDDLVLSRPRRTSMVKCPQCEHLFDVARKHKVSGASVREVAASVPISFRVLLVSGLLVLLVIVFMLGRFLSPGEDDSYLVPEVERVAEVVPEVVDEVAEFGEAPDVDKALSTANVAEFLREFFKARTWQERYPMVRQTPQIEEKMRRWYAWHKDGPFLKVAADKQATELGTFMVLKLHGQGLRSDHLVVEKTLAGYRVDWESFVIYQDQEWSEIKKEQPRGARMLRCTVQAVQNNHPEWTADAGYRCYQLTHPVTGEVFFAYLASGAAVDEATQALLKTPKGRFTLEVYYPEKSARSEDVMISRVVAKGWVIK